MVEVVVIALLGIMVEMTEQALIDPTDLREKPWDIIAVPYELFAAAFGIIYSAESVTPEELAGPLTRPYRWLIYAGILALGSTTFAGVFVAEWTSHQSTAYVIFRVVLPDTAGVLRVVYAVLTAQLAGRTVKHHVELP